MLFRLELSLDLSLRVRENEISLRALAIFRLAGPWKNAIWPRALANFKFAGWKGFP